MEEKRHGKSNPYTFEEKKDHAIKIAKIKHRFEKLGIYHYSKEILNIDNVEETIDATHIRHLMNGNVMNFNLLYLIENRIDELEIIYADFKQVMRKL